VKRRQRLPLFTSTEPDVYLIDTSAWLDIDLREDAGEVWQFIVDLIEQGRIVACAEVLGELQENPIYLLRLERYEAALRAGDRKSDDIEYLIHVGKITHEHPAMSKATAQKTPADPYVIALAELEGYVIVADETCRKRPNRKIPGVCKMRQMRCMTLDEFVKAMRKETSKIATI
jgi:hypothetical protein